MKEFSIKDLGKDKTIIEKKIIQNFLVSTLKIDQKKYIQDLLESKKKTLCYPIVFLVKACSTFFLDQLDDFEKIDMIVYQHLVRKLMYLNCGTCLNIAFVVG